jgi:hypothetical protein
MSGDLLLSVENVSTTCRSWDTPSTRLKSPLIEGLAACPLGNAAGRVRLHANLRLASG